ncbi:MAG: hypothetical protein IAE94_00325 [Chthoniobacterales bacterium]|nr:hypothetical protein [Chthoniobacterales bacterium]
MKILEFLYARLQGEPPIHPLDRRLAKRWVKERLKRLYPELRRDPEALEQAYQELGLEPQEGTGKGGATVFQITLPGEVR